ncbi:MAG TPA: histidine phosphatase family protein [Acidimicrobiales bacterium]|nr:histidine phosphatase family protein [Acidimicrobiales bacterium]
MLVLVRHGEAAGNAERKLLGRSQSPLTERGRAEAAALAPMVRGAGRLVTSPLQRCRDTASALGLSVPIEVDERWVEVDYGDFEGCSLSEVPRATWQRWRSDPHDPWPGGESLADVGLRVRACCEELFAREGTGARADADVVVVSHVSPIKAAVAWALGAGDELAWKLYLATASVTRIAWAADGPVLRSYNETVLSPG